MPCVFFNFVVVEIIALYCLSPNLYSPTRYSYCPNHNPHKADRYICINEEKTETLLPVLVLHLTYLGGQGQAAWGPVGG